MQLLSIDLKQMRQGTKLGAFLIIFALATLLGSLPVLMFGIAGLIHLMSRMPLEYAWLLVGICATVTGIVLLALGIRHLGHSASTLKRSQQEFQRNLEWMRGVLHHD